MYELFEDAASWSLGPLTIYLYGLFIALGGVLALVLFALLAKKQAFRSGTAALFGVMAIPFALILSRVFYCLLDTGFQAIGSLKLAFHILGGGLSMVGALAGIMLAAFVCAKIQKIRLADLLDVLAPAILLFILFERLGEGFTALGISRPLVYETLKNTFLAQSDAYDSYLRTWLLEAAVALILLFISLVMSENKRKSGLLFGRITLLYAATQTFFESLRYDQHMKYGFVGAQHIIFMLILCTVVICFAVKALRAGGNKLPPALSIAVLPIVAVLLILLEFKLDRTSMNRFLIYGLYAMLLAVPTVLGFMLPGKEARE